MSNRDQFLQFVDSHWALYDRPPSPEEIAAFHQRHYRTADCPLVIGEERAENAGTRDTVRSSFAEN